MCGLASCAGQGGGYYVSVVQDRRVGLLLGPYEEHRQALENVERGRALACEADPWCDFASFGTLRLNVMPYPPGTFGL